MAPGRQQALSRAVFSRTSFSRPPFLNLLSGEVPMLPGGPEQRGARVRGQSAWPSAPPQQLHPFRRAGGAYLAGAQGWPASACLLASAPLRCPVRGGQRAL